MRGLALAVAQRVDLHVVDEHGAVLALVAHQHAHRLVVAQRFAQRVELLLVAILALQQPQVLAEQVGGFVTGEPAERGVDVDDQAIAGGVADDDAFGRDVERAAQEISLEAVHALPAVSLSRGAAAERASRSWLARHGVAGVQLVALGRGPAAHADQAQVRGWARSRI